MSTPEERLKKRAEELFKHLPETPAQIAAREQQEIRQTARRLRNVGEAYLKRAETLIDVTRARIFHELDYSKPGTRPSFTLKVGTFGVLQATVEGDGWLVTVRRRGPGGVSTRTCSSDDAFLGVKDDLLETLVASALAALASGIEQPAPDPYGRR